MTTCMCSHHCTLPDCYCGAACVYCTDKWHQLQLLHEPEEN